MKVILVPESWSISNGVVNSGFQNHNTTVGSSHVLINGISYPVCTPVNNGATLTHNPLISYWQWYTGRNQVDNKSLIYIGDAEIQYRCWDHQQLNDWLEKNLTQQVLIQRYHSTWSMLFVNSLDHKLFLDWWPHLVRRHQICIDMEHSLSTASRDKVESLVQLWCRDNLKGQWIINRHQTSIEVNIRDDAEAVLFTLYKSFILSVNE